MKQKTLPKWQTDANWAVRRAKRKKQRLPEEVESLFAGHPDHCLSYTRDALRSSLPDFLVESVCNHYREEIDSNLNSTARLAHAQKAAALWIIAYVVSGGKLNDSLKALFIDATHSHMNYHYDWGRSKVLKLAEVLGNDVFSELENLIWKQPDCAFNYCKTHQKRMPVEHEEKNLLEAEDEQFVEYVKLIFKGERASDDIERLLLEKPIAACMYAESVSHGKLPEAIHSSLIMRTFGNTDDEIKESISEYLDFVKKTKIHASNVLAEFDKNDTVESVLKKLKE
jgi:hypothetical protein